MDSNVMTSATIDDLESQVRWYCRRLPAVLTTAKGARVWDENGNVYIDFFAGAGVLNYGHNPEPLKRALMDYALADGIVHSLDLRTAAKRAFMQDFEETILRPRDLRYRMMFSGPTGTNAVEAALKLARKITGRPNVAAFTNAFHGMSLGSLAATGARSSRRAAGVPLIYVDRLPYDGYFGDDIDTLQLITQLLDDSGSGIDPPAAFLVETVQGEGGVHSASLAWLQGLAALAKRYECLLIIDEIQTGCGRTGAFFSFERAGLMPDVICLSKAISGLGLPMSMILIRPELDVWKPGDHTGTFRGNNYAFITGRAALEYWRDPEFLATLARNIQVLDLRLNGLMEQLPADRFSLRGLGMIRGIAAEATIAENICNEAYRRGVLLETSGACNEVVKLLPPLNIETDLLEDGLDRLEEAVLLTV